MPRSKAHNNRRGEPKPSPRLISSRKEERTQQPQKKAQDGVKKTSEPIQSPNMLMVPDRFTLVGRLVDMQTGAPIGKRSVIVFSGTNQNGALSPLGQTQSDQRGAFALGIPSTNAAIILRSPGVKNIDGSENIPVPFEVADGNPLLIPVKVDTDSSVPFDTESIDVPTAPDNSSLAAPTSIYSQDLGTGACIKLNMPNRSLEEFSYLTVVRLSEPVLQRKRAELSAPAIWDTDIEDRNQNQAVELAKGHLLRFKQTWRFLAYSLGELLYSLALAPGQKKQIAVVDWERREAASRTEDAVLRDQLTNSLVRDRDVSDIVRATLSERVQGSSMSFAGGGATGASGAGSGSAQSGGGQSGSGGGSLGGVVSSFGGGGASYTTAGQSSNRDLSASEIQRIHDATMQAASSVRSLRSTVIQTVAQSESTRAMTEVVANHNHSHALTIEYFEVLRHFLVEHELVAVEPCLFVPMSVAAFDRARMLRWREVLAPRLLNSSLSDAFDVAERMRQQELQAANNNDEVWTVTATLWVVFRIARPQEYWQETGVGGAQDHFQEDGSRWDRINALNDEPYDSDWQYEYDRTHYAYHRDASVAERETDFQTEVAPKVAASFVRLLDCGFQKWASPDVDIPCRASLVDAFQPNTPIRVVIDTIDTHPTTIGLKLSEVNMISVQNDKALPFGSQVVVQAMEVRATTANNRDVVLDKRDLNLDLIPAVGETAVSFKIRLGWDSNNHVSLEDERRTQQLIDHLNGHAEYYHALLWNSLDEYRRFLLLDGIVEPKTGNSLASQVENKLITIVGNSLVFRQLPEPESNSPAIVARANPQEKLLGDYAPQTKAPLRVSIPTRGIFAEAILGECNASEEIDDNRFWRWSQEPIDEPTAIQPVSTESRATEAPDLKPSPFPNSLINIQAPPQFPDPTGLASALDLLGKLGPFRDVTAVEQTAKNAIEAFKTASEGAKALAQDAAELARAETMRRGGFDKTLEATKKAKSEGLLDDDEAKKVVGDALKTMVPGLSSDKGKEPLIKDPAIGSLLDSAAKQPSDVTVERPGERVSVKTENDGQNGSSSSPKKTTGKGSSIERVLRFISTYPGTSTPVEGLYDFGITEVLTDKHDAGSFDIRVGKGTGTIRTSLPAGAWTLDGRISATIPASEWKVPVQVIPGIDPFDFAVSGENATNVIPLDIVGQVSVKNTSKVIDILIEPVFDKVDIEREIEVSATGTSELNAEVKAAVEAEGNIVLANATTRGELGFGAKFGLSGTVGQKIKLTITYKRVTDFKIIQK